MSEFDHSHVRLRFLKSMFIFCVLPAATVALVLRTTETDLGTLTIPSYLTSVILVAVVRVLYADHVEERAASQLGARRIPRVVGKWPGSIDIIPRLLADMKSGYMHDVFLELFHEYQSTTLNLRIMWTDKIITMDQEHIKHIFANGFQQFSRGNAGKEILESFLGKGMLNRDDEVWKAHRTLARPFFANDRVADFELFEKHTQRVVSVLSSKDVVEASDIHDLVNRFTMDASSEFLCGQSVDTLSFKNDGFDAFVDAFDKIQKVALDRNYAQSIWPLLEIFRDKAAPYAKTIQAWLDPVINRALEHKRSVRDMGLKRLDLDQSTFLEYLADSTDDDVAIRDQLIGVLFAARDTTSAVLSFTLYLLAMHPQVLKKVRQEILKQVGDDIMPTAESFKELKYLRAVINESMRLFTPLPSNIRASRSQGVVFPKADPTFTSNSSNLPLYMPPDTPILVFPFLMQRSTALWGEDAEVFDPERWIDPVRSKNISEEPTKFIPFSLGPRVCIGQNYGLNEVSYFLVRLFQRFDQVELAEDKQLAPPWITGPTPTKPGVHPGSSRKAIEKIWPGYTISTHIKGGLWLRFRKAGDY